MSAKIILDLEQRRTVRPCADQQLIDARASIDEPWRNVQATLADLTYASLHSPSPQMVEMVGEMVGIAKDIADLRQQLNQYDKNGE